jgi:hypothetical protein
VVPNVDVDYIVVVGTVHIRHESTTWIPTHIVVAGREKSTLSAFIVEIGGRGVVTAFDAESNAAWGGAGYAVLLTAMPDTDAAVLRGLGRSAAGLCCRRVRRERSRSSSWPPKYPSRQSTRLR